MLIKIIAALQFSVECLQKFIGILLLISYHSLPQGKDVLVRRRRPPGKLCATMMARNLYLDINPLMTTTRNTSHFLVSF